MRPVQRGLPHLYTNGQPYNSALGGLVAKLGAYCSYCEKPLSHAHEIEHIQPKDLYPGLERHWENLLLACKNCNTAKGKQDWPLNHWLIPDRDNTFISFVYLENGIVEINPHLATAPLAAKTLELFNLNDERGKHGLLKRVIPRMECWGKAKLSLIHWHNNPTLEMEKLIIDLAKATGFFRLWMAVFADVPTVREQLLSAFPGTEPACFTTPPQPHPNTDNLPHGSKI
ncbi:MAG: HNH endonuclease [Magnetococcales bacterium]|nr:HNH endonuclease [Magnetococcales bacterium]NGZ25934.1 HNH endonuclease [Magnetococcales bacterium]